jgi:ornithine carbamoyltransferase
LNLLDIDDLTTDELESVLDRAAAIKAAQANTEASGTVGDTRAPLDGQTLAMLFEKPSTRTRISFETGMTELGGHAIFLGPDDIHLGHGEPIKDTARAMGRYADFIMARVFEHADAVDLATWAEVPVINGLTDAAHPCQTLADLLTLREHFEDPVVAWVGDGNNVCQSLVIGAAMTGLDLTVATPEGYGIDEGVMKRAEAFGNPPTTTTNPDIAVADADVVYTDVWVSMGQEDEREEKLRAFEGFQVTSDLLAGRALMHCLPAHRGEEVTDEAIESDTAIIWDQAENRLHAQKGLLAWLGDQ